MPEPSRQGYTFLGWNEEKGTLPQTFGEITSFKAVWIENSLSPISITLGKIESDAEVELTLDENKVFTATPGFAKYQWRVDGRIQMNSGNTLDMKAGLTEFNKTAGHHNVMRIVTDQDGNFYTAEATYTIVSSGGNFVVIKE